MAAKDIQNYMIPARLISCAPPPGGKKRFKIIRRHVVPRRQLAAGCWLLAAGCWLAAGTELKRLRRKQYDENTSSNNHRLLLFFVRVVDAGSEPVHRALAYQACDTHAMRFRRKYIEHRWLRDMQDNPM